jgi:hypothetical protein
MIKKQYLLFLFSTFLSFSCQKNESHGIPLLHYQKMSSAYFLSMSSTEYDELIEKNGSFIVYVLASGCQTCDVFGYILKSYIKENKYIIPFMYQDEFIKSRNSVSLTDSSIIYIENGKIKDYKSSFSDIGSKKELSDYLKSKIFDTKINIDDKIEYTTSLDSFECYHFLSEKDELDDKSDYLFVKEKKMQDYTSVINYMLARNISNLIMNQEEQEKDGGDIPYDEKTYLELQHDSQGKTTYHTFDEINI